VGRRLASQRPSKYRDPRPGRKRSWQKAIDLGLFLLDDVQRCTTRRAIPTTNYISYSNDATLTTLGESAAGSTSLPVYFVNYPGIVPDARKRRTVLTMLLRATMLVKSGHAQLR
jgi:hypothetical protein